MQASYAYSEYLHFVLMFYFKGTCDVKWLRILVSQTFKNARGSLSVKSDLTQEIYNRVFGNCKLTATVSWRVLASHTPLTGARVSRSLLIFGFSEDARA